MNYFKLIKWILGAIKSTKKTSEGILSEGMVRPQDYGSFNYFFHLKNGAELKKGSSGKKIQIDIFGYEVSDAENDTNSAKFTGERFSSARLHVFKGKKEKEYEIRKIEYYKDDLSKPIMEIECSEGIPQFGKCEKLKKEEKSDACFSFVVRQDKFLAKMTLKNGIPEEIIFFDDAFQKKGEISFKPEIEFKDIMFSEEAK